MKVKIYLTALLSSAVLFSCVSPKKLRESQAKYDQLSGTYLDLQSKYRALQDELNKANNKNAALQSAKTNTDGQVDDLKKQIDYLKQNNNTVLNQLRDMSVVTNAQAESIRKSLDNIGAKDMYIKDLQGSIARKDSLAMALVMNLKGAIGNLDDKDINIKVDKGVVYVDISDKLLFKNASYDVTERAKEVLGKVAKVLQNQPEIEFMVEGHTDSNPIHSAGIVDNWDLSVKRATSVVRILQNTYGLDPKRMTAAGRSEYLPLADNNTAGGRAANRRTRIVILPQLDQFFKLLETKK
ncbi:chemotaxis protein MotB [Hydrobacter penzbergensis]|jgi:chemotaxis protein MotB|uniref:Chemotaxis protein MotB n=1 Tax=Hydrobacter penzbergensis TaxID=1235997 RepID=A0A8X8LCC8_9BACT|nr:OmpA family protein [Hydrobacter penzbergensis]MBN8719777.1 OmpA family protein [Sediminibacterium magnilacihabitans]PQV60179.1 chemotaxis protein MotB [Sediminibacterium magnilacihabitans]SDX37837.1 chemotaxis protein MotB [Hydrobacter penzbergensis]